MAKALLILCFYMRLARAAALVRLAGAVAVLWLCLMFGLTLSCYLAR